MRRTLCLSLLVFVSATLVANAQSVVCLDTKIYDGASQPFIEHLGTGFFQSYLTMNLPYTPVKGLWKQLEKKLGRKLISRGEAHITVITPPEFTNGLDKKVSIQEIHKIAKKMKIQKSDFDVLCIGNGKKEIEGKVEETFFVVVQSADLMKIRKAVKKLFVKRGGDPSLFRPEKFYPHITIGFTKRDLHESDGVIKGDNSKDARFILEMSP